MKIIKPSFKILTEVNGEAILQRLAHAGRICYQSEQNNSHEFITKRIKEGHKSILEHESISVEVTCDRGVSHEIVRHRIASYSQESTRYCNYIKDKFGNGSITVIEPFFWSDDKQKFNVWQFIMSACEEAYMKLIELGAPPQEARSVLPNSLKTTIIMTMNLREWRHFFKLRTSPKAHPQMRELSIPLLNEFKTRIPVIFDDIITKRNENEK